MQHLQTNRLMKSDCLLAEVILKDNFKHFLDLKCEFTVSAGDAETIDANLMKMWNAVQNASRVEFDGNAYITEEEMLVNGEIYTGEVATEAPPPTVCCHVNVFV